MLNRIAFGLVTLLTISLACGATAPPIKVKIVNKSGKSPDKVFLLLSGTGASTSGITEGTSTTLQALTNSEFTLTSINAGRLYISYDTPVASNEPVMSGTRFDKVEFTYPGAGNLTSVDFFGIPLQMSTVDASGHRLQDLTFYTSFNTLKGKLAELAPTAVVPASGAFARVLSPVKAPGDYPSQESYINSLSGKTITIDGTYVGFVAPSPNTYSYMGTFASDGSIALSGTMSAAAVPNAQTLTVAGHTLLEAIYTCNGDYNVASATNNPQAVSNNDVYSAIYAAYIGAFNFGYIGSKYAPASSSNWYGTTPYNPPYAAGRSTDDGFYNNYAELIAANSDAYGFPFSDLLSIVQVGLNPGATGPYPVAELVVTILPDDALDAPILTSASSTTDSITVNWTPIPGALNYTVMVSPPLPAVTKNVPSGTVGTATFDGLKPGTPYTVSVSSTDGSKTSAAMPVLVTTKGNPSAVTGPVTWNFIPNFTGTFPGHTITFNGISQTLPNSVNPSLQFNNVPGPPGVQNAYVLSWKDASGAAVYDSVVYVTLEATPNSGMGAINQAPAETFMVANQTTPTYAAGVAFNLFLSIQPTIQRVVDPVAGSRDPGPANLGRTVFNSRLNSPKRLGTRRVRLEGRVADADGVDRVFVRVRAPGGRKAVSNAKLNGNRWVARVRHFRAENVTVRVEVFDANGNRQRKIYRVKTGL